MALVTIARTSAIRTSSRRRLRMTCAAAAATTHSRLSTGGKCVSTRCRWTKFTAGRSLDVDDHLHVAVARSAEVIADSDEAAGLVRRNRQHRLMLGREIEIDLQILLIEAMIAIQRRYVQGHRLAAFQRDL